MQQTDELNEIIRLHNEGQSAKTISVVVNRNPSTISRFLNRKTRLKFWEEYDTKPISGGTKRSPVNREKLSGKRYVFTSAQNNSHVHKEFLQTLENFCEHNNAELIVGTFHYNKHGFQNGKGQATWFDPSIRKYILNESREIAKGLIWCGELSILPTAINPLSGFHSYTQTSSGIVPHAKVQMQSLPTAKEFDTRILYTTGAVTQRNYVNMKEGQKASFHHVFGATLVEVDEDGDWFCRQLIAETKTGCFYDLDKYYTPSTVTENHDIEAVNYGDVHAAKIDEQVANISWGNHPESVLNKLKPKYQFLHDVFDMSYRNHHNIKDPYFRFKMFNNKTESVKDEIILTSSLMETMLRDYSKIVVVESNHDLALQKWLKEQDYRYDPVNALFFLELQTKTYQAMSNNEDIHIFKHACCSVNSKIKDILFLKTDESFIICNEIECGAHGHNGNNGARGSTNAFQMLGTKYNIGHQHSCGIKDGVYVAGVSGKLDMGYNIGGSSWSNSHIITYKNGKRAILTIKNGKWQAK